LSRARPDGGTIRHSQWKAAPSHLGARCAGRRKSDAWSQLAPADRRDAAQRIGCVAARQATTGSRAEPATRHLPRETLTLAGGECEHPNPKRRSKPVLRILRQIRTECVSLVLFRTPRSPCVRHA
jgi:hypothetical protein